MLKVKNILDNLYTDDILLAYMDLYKNNNMIDIYKFRTVYGNVIDSLRRIKLVRRKNYIILADYCIDEFEDENSYLDLSLFNIRALKKKFNEYSILKTLKIDEIKDYDKYIKLNDIPISIALDFIPRNEVISYYVNINNINHIGAEKFMAAILYEITFYGVFEEDVITQKNQLIQAANSTKNVQNLTQHTVTINLDDEFIENDNDSFNHDKMSKICLINKINTYN